MENVAAIAIGLLLLAWLQIYAHGIASRNPALLPWRPLLALIVFAWAGLVTLGILYRDAYFPPADALTHEAVAREVAFHLTSGNIERALSYFGAGNAGYRFIVGIFYAITAAPKGLVPAVNASLALGGLLSLLDTICRSSRARRVPLWVILIVCATPSALFWTSDNLKEGPVLWGICMMLRMTLRTSTAAGSQGLLMPLLGLATVGFMRPHIAAAYLAALAAGVALHQRKLGVGVISVAGVIAMFFMLHLAKPEIIERFANEGLMETMDRRFASRNHIGGSAIQYVAGRPIPIVTGALLIFLRPLPREIFNVSSAMAGMEIWLITLLTVRSWLGRRDRVALLATPTMLTTCFAILCLSFFFTYMYNMGLMVRQRLMVYPVLFLLASAPAVTPLLMRKVAPAAPQHAGRPLRRAA